MMSVSGVAAMGLMASPRVLLAAQSVIVKSVRMSDAPGVTRVVFDLSGPVEHSLFALHNPERVVIDLNGARSSANLKTVATATDAVRSIRHAQRNVNDLRMVLDLGEKLTARSFLLKPGKGSDYRLVVDLLKSGEKSDARPVITAKEATDKKRDVIIAIDAGHGGRDPGAIGKKGTREKDVVLKVARKLEKEVRRQKGMKAVMIRNNDTFMPLRDRIRKARTHKADLFISIHADASNDSRVGGSSVYVLSSNGATSELARFMAKRENEADLVGGVQLGDMDEQLASVLLELSQDHTIEESLDFADDVLANLKNINKLRSRRVEQAGFAVLKSPDIPSILVETAFISNPREENRLRTNAYQEKIAQALMKGVRDYFKDNAPADSILATLQSNHLG
jgi:N-acetylmuramoyl-L-alanine amidase